MGNGSTYDDLDKHGTACSPPTGAPHRQNSAYRPFHVTSLIYCLATPVPPAGSTVGNGPQPQCRHVSFRTPRSECILDGATLQALSGRPAVGLTVVVNDGGVASFGCDLHGRAGCRRIGTMIAGNSGRPGGGCTGDDGACDVSKLHANYRTQEEDVVSDWLLTAKWNAGGGLLMPDSLFSATIKRQWGMWRPNSTNNMTVQGVDYVNAEEASAYADAWVVDAAHLSRKSFCSSYPTDAFFDFSDQYPTQLYFVSAPNAAGANRSACGSMARTYNKKAASDRNFFLKGVACAVRSGLLAMVEDGITDAILPVVGGGLYAGQWAGTGLTREYMDIVERLLAERIPESDPEVCLGSCFSSVTLVLLKELRV